MRRLTGLAAVCALSVIFAAPAGQPVRAAGQAPVASTSTKKDAAAVLAAARQALGGDAKLNGVKTLIASGRTRQVRGENLVPIEFEISIELPDKYLRRDEIPAQESGPNASGFNGDDLLQDPPPPPMPMPPAGRADARGAGPGGPPRNPAAARVAGLKQDFARLMLGLFASSFSGYPLTFTYAAEAEAPQGTADVLDVKGPDTFAMRFFIATDTHLPIMVSWRPPASAAARGGPGRVMMAPGTPPARPPAPAAAPPENRLYFAEYRDVDGLQFPFRLRRAVGADTVEETTFDRFRVNAKIDPKKFEVRK
ncbi:MAG TPA: hypothetical protein VGL62_07015 [Vicinamibacterales bacterium]|jgi:hypothetical protein